MLIPGNKHLWLVVAELILGCDIRVHTKLY